LPEGFESGLVPEGTAAYFMATTATNTTHLTPTLRWRVFHLSQRLSVSTRPLSPLRGSKRLHQLSKSGAESREFWALAGVQPLSEFTKDDADLWRKASAYKGL